jgi:hypothetical protein
MVAQAILSLSGLRVMQKLEVLEFINALNVAAPAQRT